MGNGPPIDGQFLLVFGKQEVLNHEFLFFLGALYEALTFKSSKQKLMGLVFPSFSDKPSGYFTLPDA